MGYPFIVCTIGRHGLPKGQGVAVMPPEGMRRMQNDFEEISADFHQVMGAARGVKAVWRL
jgi:hypothetical protein